MTTRVEVRLLQRDDDRSRFSSGHPALDRFFHYYAGQNQFRHHLAVTWVAAAGDAILGYATVAASSLARRTLPSTRMRRRLPDYPLPVVRLARLAVDERARGRGLGRLLLRRVLEQALEQRDRLGCVGVVTDAKPEAVAFYERHGFVALQGVREGTLHDEPAPMFLSIETIAKAVSA